MRRIVQMLAKWEWVLLLLLLPFLLFPTGGRALLLLAIPLLWLGRWLATRHFVPQTPLDGAILLLLTMVLVSLLVVFDIALSLPKVAGVVLGVALFYGTVAYIVQPQLPQSWLRIGHVVAFLGVAGTGIAAIGVMGANWQRPFTFLNRFQSLLPTALGHIPGTIDGFVNLNELAGVLDGVVALYLVCLVGLWPQLWPQRKGMLAALAGVTLFCGAVLLATLSRGGILALGLALLVTLAIRFRWGRWLLLTAVGLGFMLAIDFDIAGLIRGQNSRDPLLLEGRLEIWSRALYGIADFPFTGMSMNGFRRVVHILYPLFSVPPDSDIGHAHNQLLQAALDLGLPGLIAYLALWLVSVGLLWQSWRWAQTPPTRTLVLALGSSLLAGWLFGLLDAVTLGARPGFLWWLLLALIVAVHDIVGREAKVNQGVRSSES